MDRGSARHLLVYSPSGHGVACPVQAPRFPDGEPNPRRGCHPGSQLQSPPPSWRGVRAEEGAPGLCCIRTAQAPKGMQPLQTENPEKDSGGGRGKGSPLPCAFLPPSPSSSSPPPHLPQLCGYPRRTSRHPPLARPRSVRVPRAVCTRPCYVPVCTCARVLCASVRVPAHVCARARARPCARVRARARGAGARRGRPGSGGDFKLLRCRRERS